MMHPRSAALRIERLPGNPIIRPAMLPAHDGANINGSSLIRVPPWIPNPLRGTELSAPAMPPPTPRYASSSSAASKARQVRRLRW